MTIPAGVRAGLLAIVWGLLLLLGTPGLDGIPRAALSRPNEIRAYEALLPRWSLPIAQGVVRANDELRRPLVDALDPLQRPLRVQQNWSLYLDGPDRCRRLEVEVDGVLRHRTLDPEHVWIASTLRSPSFRPVADTLAGHTDVRANGRGLLRWIGRRAERDFPGAREVVVRAVWGSFPGCVGTEHHRFVVKAPTWE